MGAGVEIVAVVVVVAGVEVVAMVGVDAGTAGAVGVDASGIVGAGAVVVVVVGVVTGVEVVPGADIWSPDSFGEVGALAGAIPGVS